MKPPACPKCDRPPGDPGAVWILFRGFRLCRDPYHNPSRSAAAMIAPADDAFPLLSRFDSRRTSPYRMKDPLGNVVRVDYAGPCVVCRRRTYTIDGNPPDWRGPAGMNASAPLDPADHGIPKDAGMVPVCAECANDSTRYDKAFKVALRMWGERGHDIE